MIATFSNAQRHIISAILAVLLIGAAAVQGQVAHAETAKLSSKTVSYFIISFPQIKEVVAKHGIESAGKTTKDTNAFTAVIEAATDETLHTSIDKIARRSGFRDMKDWLSTAQAVTKCYVYLKLSPSKEKTRKKVEKFIRKIKKNSFLNDKQKRQAIEAVRKNFGIVMEEPPAENLAAVKPFIPELDALVN